MRTLLLLLLLISLNSPIQAQDKAAKMDEYMQAVVANGNFSGTVLVAQGNEVIFKKGYGYAVIEHQIPNKPDVVFRLGSVTKQFTSMAIMQLVEEEKLDLTKTISTYLPDYPAKQGKKVTIHHLLTHTSGIPSYTSDSDFMDFQASIKEEPTEFIKRFWEKDLEFEPGMKYSYNNSGYYLLGVILEKVEGKPYRKIIEERIFQPLSMTQSGFEHFQDMIPNRAFGYAAIGENAMPAEPIITDNAYAAGALYSTVEDLYKWHQALSEGKLLSKASYGKMYTPALQNYAYGWIVTESDGELVHLHTGGINGFSTIIIRLPKKDAVVIALSNFESSPTGKIGSDLASILLGKPYEIPEKKVVVEVNPEIYDNYEGIYHLAPSFAITITRKGDRLFAQATNQPEFEIFPESETLYFLKVVEAKLEFVRNNDGKVDQVILYQGGRQQTGERKE